MTALSGWRCEKLRKGLIFKLVTCSHYSYTCGILPGQDNAAIFACMISALGIRRLIIVSTSSSSSTCCDLSSHAQTARAFDQDIWRERGAGRVQAVADADAGAGRAGAGPRGRPRVPPEGPAGRGEDARGVPVDAPTRSGGPKSSTTPGGSKPRLCRCWPGGCGRGSSWARAAMAGCGCWSRGRRALREGERRGSRSKASVGSERSASSGRELGTRVRERIPQGTVTVARGYCVRRALCAVSARGARTERALCRRVHVHTCISY